MHTYRVPIYEVGIQFTRSRKEFAKAVEAAGGFDDGQCADGLTCALDSGGFIVGVFTKDPGTMAHEMAHVALDILEWAGFDAQAGNQEPFCYLLGHLINHFSKVR
jgi:hypothetical protein